MGVNNRQRRAAKTRKRSRPRSAPHTRGQHEHGDHGAFDDSSRPRQREPERVRAMLASTAREIARGAPSAFVNEAVDELAAIDPGLVCAEGEAEALRMVGAAWQNGWQPAELAREGRRRGARIARLINTAVAGPRDRRYQFSRNGSRSSTRRSTRRLARWGRAASEVGTTGSATSAAAWPPIEPSCGAPTWRAADPPDVCVSACAPGARTH